MQVRRRHRIEMIQHAGLVRAEHAPLRPAIVPHVPAMAGEEDLRVTVEDSRNGGAEHSEMVKRISLVCQNKYLWRNAASGHPDRRRTRRSRRILLGSG